MHSEFQRASYLIGPMLFLVLTGIEYIVYSIDSRWGRYNEVKQNFISAFGSVLVSVILSVPFSYIYLACSKVAPFHLQNTLFGFVIAFGVFEFKHYLEHRLSHRVGVLWAFHSVHHSSRIFNVPVSARMFWGNTFVQPLTFALPLLGVSIFQFGIILLATGIVGIVSHTRVIPKLGILEAVLMTPSNHRVHHGCQPIYIDRNYGQALCVFDRVLGTYQAEVEEPIYGLPHEYNEKSPFLFQIYGIGSLARKVRAAPSLRSKLLSIVMPPEWEHNSAAGSVSMSK